MGSALQLTLAKCQPPGRSTWPLSPRLQPHYPSQTCSSLLSPCGGCRKSWYPQVKLRPGWGCGSVPGSLAGPQHTEVQTHYAANLPGKEQVGNHHPSPNKDSNLRSYCPTAGSMPRDRAGPKGSTSFRSSGANTHLAPTEAQSGPKVAPLPQVGEQGCL